MVGKECCGLEDTVALGRRASLLSLLIVCRCFVTSCVMFRVTGIVDTLIRWYVRLYEESC